VDLAQAYAAAMKTRGISAAAAAVALTWSAFSGAGVGAAAPDPYFPLPPSWCPGNPPGALTASGYGGYCEGNSYPDGTRWNAYSIGLLWQPVRCITQRDRVSAAGPARWVRRRLEGLKVPSVRFELSFAP